jgi:hypothetical protein
MARYYSSESRVISAPESSRKSTSGLLSLPILYHFDHNFSRSERDKMIHS